MSNKRRYVPNLIADMAECDGITFVCTDCSAHGSEDQLEFGVDSGAPGNSISGQTEDGATVVISILERCPYTTMMSVKVTSDEDRPWIR